MRDRFVLVSLLFAFHPFVPFSFVIALLSLSPLYFFVFAVFHPRLSSFVMPVHLFFFQAAGLGFFLLEFLCAIATGQGTITIKAEDEHLSLPFQSIVAASLQSVVAAT